MSDLSTIGNLAEAILWLVFAVAFGVMACRANGRRRRLFTVLLGAFLVFAVSDLIEAQTGAWWRPIWLLLLKAACIGVFTYSVLEYKRIDKTEGTQPRRPVDQNQPSRGETQPASSD